MLRGGSDSASNPDYPPYQVIKRSNEYILRCDAGQSHTRQRVY